MDIGTGFGITGASFASAAVIISGIRSYFLAKSGNVVIVGYNAEQCKKDHQDINNQFAHIESEKVRLENKTEKIREELSMKVERDASLLSQKLDDDRKGLYAVLARIEKKIDDHKDYHLNNK